LSALLSVNPLTVKKAYDALAVEGLLESRAGLGTFVSSAPRRLANLARPGRGEADRLLVDAVAAARHIGMTLEEFQRRAGDVWRMEKDYE
jgi:DNA-binding transcriptional regulator YhcF (GntR family)